MEKHPFLKFINDLNTGITTFHGSACSGKTLSLLNIVQLLDKKNKRIAYVDGDYGQNSFESFNFSENVLVLSRENGLPEFNEEKIKLLTENFNYLILESFEYIIEDNFETNLLAGNSRKKRKYLDILRRYSEETGCIIILSTTSFRQALNQNDNNSNYVLNIDHNLSFSSNNIIEISRKSEDDKVIFSYNIQKSRQYNSKQTKFLFELNTENLDIFSNPFTPEFNFFNNKVKGWRENSVLEISLGYLDSLFPDYCRNHLKLSKKQTYKLWDKIILNKNILNTYDCFKIEESREGELNFNILNSIIILKKTYTNFDFQKFYNKFNNIDFKSNDLMTINSDRQETFFIFFLKEMFSFEKSLSLFKNFFENEQRDGFNLLYATAMSYSLLQEKINAINILDKELLNNYTNIKGLKKKINKKKSFLDIFMLIESESKKIESIQKELSEEIFSKKMLNFKENNKNISNEIYDISIPTSIKEVIKNGEYFQNCTADGFFIERLVSNLTLLFYFKSKNKSYRDLCVHLDRDLSLIEIKCPNNKIISNEEQHKFLELKNQLTI